MRVYLIWIFLIFLQFGVAFQATSNPVDDFSAGVEHFRNEQYKDAIQVWEKLHSEGEVSADLYYNLGNAYYRDQQWGRAVLSYERALLLNPNFDDATYNLLLVKERLTDNLAEVDAFFLNDWWIRASKVFPSNVWSVLGLLLIAGSLGMIAAFLTKRIQLRRRWLVLSIALGFMVGSICLLLGHTRKQAVIDPQYAIILVEETPLYSGADLQSVELTQIHEGLKINIQDRIGDWFKVRLSDGDIGWLPKEVLEFL